MRLRGMPAAANQLHFKGIGIRHAHPVMDAGNPLIHRRPVMHAPDSLHVELVEQPVLDHRQTTTATFLGWLENEKDGAIKITGFGKILGRAKQHCGVAIMPAGMHLSRDFRGMFKFIQFVNGQRVDIRPQPNGTAGITLPTQHANNACLAHAAMHLNAESGKLFRNKIRRPDLFIAKLRMLVQCVAPASHVVRAVSDGVDHSHGRLSRVAAG